MIGRVVCSKAGRDKGRFMVVVEVQKNGLLVCDGKERPLQRPKLKNQKHLAFTNTCLEKEKFLSNKSLRKALADFGGAEKFSKEGD